VRWALVLRATALVLVAGAVVDPGCVRVRPPAVSIVTAPGADEAMRARVTAAVAAAGFDLAEGQDGPARVRVALGTPAAMLDLHARRPVQVAVRPAAPGLAITDVVAPAVAVAGMAVHVGAWIDGHGLAGERARLRLRDERTGQVVGWADAELPSSGTVWVEAVVLPTTGGDWQVCADAILVPHATPDAAVTGAAAAAAASSDVQACGVRVTLDVRDDTVRVHVIEARPGWAGRFARLALEGWERADVRTDSRVAPGATVRTHPARPPSSARPAGPSPDADVIIVSGLDGLAAGDVRHVRAAAADRGATVLLLADGELPGQLLRELWPDAPGRLVSGSAPRPLVLGRHRWLVREWLEPPRTLSGVSVLASAEGAPAIPMILARPLGRGRVVLITALDGWRWRHEDGASFVEGWQALVLSLWASGPGPDVMTWRLPEAMGDEVHVAVGWPGGENGVRRAAWRGLAPTDAVTLPLFRPGVAADEPDVVHVGPRVPAPGGWSDLARALAGDGGEVAREEDVPAAVARAALAGPGRAVRWRPSGEWWYAMLAIGLLGAEWCVRRLAREA
jgi:hypothetical protein